MDPNITLSDNTESLIKDENNDKNKSISNENNDENFEKTSQNIQNLSDNDDTEVINLPENKLTENNTEMETDITEETIQKSSEENANENNNNTNNRTDLQNTTVSFIISCSKKSSFNDNINVLFKINKDNNIDVLNFEIIDATKFLSQNYNSKNSQHKKNIFIYKANLNLTNNTEKFKIIIQNNKDKLISNSTFEIEKYQYLFIFNQSFDFYNKSNQIIKNFKKIKNYFNNKPNIIFDIINRDYIIPDEVKFNIYKNYLINNDMTTLMEFLLEKSKDCIINTDKIDINIILNYISTLIDKEYGISNLNNFLEPIIINLFEKEDIYFNEMKNNDYYSELMKILKNCEITDFNDISLTGYYLLLLIGDQKCNNENEFSETFNKIPLKQNAIEFILKHKKIFQNLHLLNLQTLFENADKTKTSFNDVLSHASTYNDYIEFFCLNEDYILSQNPNIKFKNGPELDETTDISLFIKFLEILSKMTLSKNDLKAIKDIFISYIDILRGKDYNKLLTLREVFKNLSNFPISEEIIKKINYTIHSTGKLFIKDGKLNNLEIISFIQEDAKYYWKDYEKKPDYASLIGYIDLENIDDEFCSKFIGDINNNYNYEKLFKKQYKNFLDELINKAESMKHLKSLFKIFNIENEKTKVNDQIIKNILDLFNNKNLEKNIPFDEVKLVIYQLFMLVSKSTNTAQYLKSLINAIKKNFSEEEINDMFIYICNIKDNKLSRLIIGKLIENFNIDVSNDYIVNILDTLEDINIKMKFIGNLKNRVIKEEDIFNIKYSENMKLLIELIERGYFKINDKKFKNIPYIKKTNTIIMNNRKKLEEFQISMDQMKIMNHLLHETNDAYRNNLKKRFTILTLGDSTKTYIIESLYNKIEKKIKECMNIFGKIDNIISIFQYYYPNEKKMIIDIYERIREDIMKKPIKDFPRHDQLYDFDKLCKEIDELSQLRNSKFFSEIYKNIKDNRFESSMANESNEHFLVKETKEKFDKLKNLFDEENENKIDLVFLEEILSSINNNEIRKEINTLIVIFEMDKNNLPQSITKIENKLKFFKERKTNINKFEKILLFLRDFNLKEKDIQIKLYELTEILKNNLTFKEIIFIHEELNKLDINVLKKDKFNSNALSLIIKMYEKPELINFIDGKEISDIHQMCEFIDDSEDFYLTLGDIGQLETCMSFIQELRKESSKWKSETEFLDAFIKITKLESNYKDITDKFENSYRKFNDIKVLYNNHLNPSELNKVHIKRIFESSEFHLKFEKQDYQCRAHYRNNNRNVVKKFDDILELREVALLRKKDQKEKEYFQICDRFANIINNIQKILYSLNTISSQGYFEEIEYIINIHKGEAFVYKENSDQKPKKLNEIIEELKNIQILQNNEIKSIYFTNPIIRMIYGRQFNYIYNYMKAIDNNIPLSNNLKNIFNYITNNNCKSMPTYIDIKENSETPLKQMLIDVCNFLTKLYDINFIKLNQIYEKALLLNNINKKGIYSHYCRNEDIEKNAIHCSLKLTGNYPLAQTVLYCNNDTSKEEITSFIYRSIKCDQNVLFILIKPEILNIDKKELLIKLLNELYASEPKKMKSCLLFIYSEEKKTNEIITEFENLPNHKYYDFNENNEEDKEISPRNMRNRNIIGNNRSNVNEFKRISDVEIYSSEVSGLGKSRLIKKDFNEKYPDYTYVYFPVGDEINKNDIIMRLLELNHGQKIALHLDLKDTSKIEFMNEFLFKFLILKYYYQNENMFYYGNEIKIMVEIQNSFIDFKILYPILDFFNGQNITFNNMPPLHVSKKIKSKVQVVSFYLKHLKEIDKYDIYIDGININIRMNGILINERTINFIDFDEPLQYNECRELISKYLNINNPNYYQIKSYINILYEQLVLFSRSDFLKTSILSDYNNDEILHIRHFFIDSLTKITKYFITSSFNNIIKDQNVTFNQQRGKLDWEKAHQEALTNLTRKETFSIKKIKPSLILINEDGNSLSIIPTCDKKSNEYKLLNQIVNTLDPLTKELINYKKLSTKEFLNEVNKVLNLNKSMESLEEIVKSYVFTEDNFVKLILISLRLRTDIPVILMGETGCGKTSLIRIIAKFKDIPLLTLNIHAGIEDDDIIQFIKENDLYEDINKNASNTEKNDLVWVFLDEINTCNSLGLISEIMLKRSCKGEKLRKNVKFIAACNPYRIDTSEKEIVGLCDEKKNLVRKLVYRVNPLPYSLLNFVFDFGSPGRDDIKKYIANMVSEMLQPMITNNYIINKVKGIAERAIYDSHEYIKNAYDISSVSLREVRRFGILFEWFANKLLENPYLKEKLKLTEEIKYINALNLSIYLCYYIRIFNKEKRKGFLKEMRHSFGVSFNFEEFPKKIQNIIANAVELDKGIAKNKALLENLFSIFVCLNTKIPLFIIGKPGCSKSLSAQLIFKSMNGNTSSHEFFKTFPKVYTRSYQGSDTSNSKGILNIFKKARDALNDNNNNNNSNSNNNEIINDIGSNNDRNNNNNNSNDIISAIYFDEMGLAENSKNNPLKVLHSQLEYDDNEKKVAFIGISNWPFDASKMNRGIHLSIPEPDEEDLMDNALSIAESYDSRLKQNYTSEFKHLSKAYFEYKKLLKDNPFSFESTSATNTNFESSMNNIKEFHGTRDFYHLIKIACKLFMKHGFTKDTYKIESILNESIERNFGGLDHSIEKFKGILKRYYPSMHDTNDYDVMKCIVNNIQDPMSRYLLIETKNSVSQFLIILFLNKLNKKYNFYYGSSFEEDTTHGYYSAKVLNKVQVTMNEDGVMILKNLTSMYPSLYDLFNQNFRRMSGSNYARIALGDSNTQNYKVHDNFRCIVLLDRNEINKQDPPFINRFEKHIITFDVLLSDKQKNLSNQIYNSINNLIMEENNENSELKLDLKAEIINCDIEEIQGMMYQILLNKANDEENMNNKDINIGNNDKESQSYENENDENGNDDEDNRKEKNSLILTFDDDLIDNSTIKKEIYKKIVPTFPQDLIFYSKNSNYGIKHEKEFQSILDIYFQEEHQHKNLESYLKSIKTNKHIIYTFSNIFYEIGTINNIHYGTFRKETTLNVLVSKYNSERYIDDIISDYFNNDNHNLCIFHFKLEDCIHLNDINYLIENYENLLFENENNNLHKRSKPILFIIHLKRNSIQGKKNININNYLLSHLTEWKQFFVDNLNGKDINLKEILHATNDELFENKNIFNLDEEFNDNLYHAFSCIKYNFKVNLSDFDYDTYIEKACRYIINNRKLKKEIQSLVLKKIKMVKENIIHKIFYHYNFEENDVDFVSIIVKYIKSLYNDALISTIIQFEQKQIISAKMLSDLKDDEFTEKIYQSEIENFDTNLRKNSALSRERIDLYLGISFPCIIQSYIEIHKYIKNKLIDDYFTNENHNYLKDKNIYDEEKENLEKNIINEFRKYKFSKIFQFTNNDDDNYLNDHDHNLDQNKLVQILFKDYIIYYLSNSDTLFSNKNIINFFIVLYELFLSEDTDDNKIFYNDITFKDLIKFILFIESYSSYIYSICRLICSLDIYIYNFIDTYISKLSNNIFKSKKKSIPKINALFINIYESLVYCILNIYNNENEITNEHFILLMEELKIFSDSLIKVNEDLRIKLKQIYYLQDFLNVKEAFIKEGISFKENYKEYLKYLSDENEMYLLSEDFDQNENSEFNFDSEDTIEPIDKEFDFLKEYLSSSKYSNLVIKILNNKMKISNNEDYRLILLKILSENDTVINRSKIIFETLFKNYKLCPIDKTIENDENNSDESYSDEESEDEEDNTSSDEENESDLEDENEDVEETNDEDEENESDIEDEDEDNENDIDDEDIEFSNNEDEDDNYESYDESEDNDEDDDDGTGVKFLNKLEKEKSNPIIAFLNSNENIRMDEVLLSLFDGNISKYFESKHSEDDRILNQSLQIFKNCVNYIESFQYESNSDKRLGVLYCISYIKLYCYNLSKIIFERGKKQDDDLIEEEILEFINGNNEFRKVIKIYILKVLNKIVIKDYNALKDFINKHEIFINDFDFNEKVPCALNYLFIQNDTFNSYMDYRKIYRINKMEQYRSSNEISNKIKTNDILIFYDLIINEEISNLRNLRINGNNSKMIDKLYSYISDILNYVEMPVLSEKMISIYFKIKSMKKQLSFIQNISPMEYEMLLYSHKFAFICSFSQPNTLYSNILSENLKQNIENIYIPGGEPKFNLKMESAYEIKKFFERKKEAESEEVYMCSCGYWYVIGDCGRPWDENKCKICHETIGGKSHKLFNRPGHVRVCRNEEHRRKFIEDIPYILIDDLMNEVETLKNTPIKGFQKVLKSNFIKNNKPVRYINHITYRILSFIFYSCIYYSEKLEFIKSEELKMFYYEDAKKEDKSILSILKDIWKALEKELSKRGIDNIQIFLNMIMSEINELISRNEYSMTSPEEREIFEHECNNIVNEAISNYINYHLIYINNNNNILEIKDDTIKAILEETSNLNNLSQESYPFIQYFYAADYPSYGMFMDQFLQLQNISKYPVINNYLTCSLEKVQEIKFLENFKLINPLITYAIEKYSNKISRAQAKETLIKDELEDDEDMKKLFKMFRKGWKNIYKNLSNYDCHGKLPEKDITEEDCIAYILNDNREDNFGKYIASAYKDFITYQNSFLQSLIEPNAINSYLNPYAEQIGNKIIVQNASENVLMSYNIKTELFNSFNDLINAFSYRNYIKEDGNINYLNYKEINYDFNFIEVELTKILLPEKRLLFDETKQKFISYMNEGFANNANIITDFMDKIVEIKPLSSDDKSSIDNINQKIDYKIILINLETLFSYFTNKRNINGNELLIEEIKHIPREIIKLNEDFIRTIVNLQLNIHLNQLIDFYDYIEVKNFNKIIKEVSNEAKNDLDSTQENNLRTHFNNKNILITKKDLENALRKIISRFLANNIYKHYDWNICWIIDKNDKPELWNNIILSDENNERFDKELHELEKFNIKIGQSVAFYKYVKNKAKPPSKTNNVKDKTKSPKGKIEKKKTAKDSASKKKSTTDKSITEKNSNKSKKRNNKKK